jgi:hypothetical protein
MEPRYEHCLTKTNRVARLLTRAELQGKVGYRSVYGFSEVSCAYFRDINAVKNSRGMVVYCDELLVDIDDDEPAAAGLYTTLCELGVAFSTWDSGGRSIHFHIPHEPVWSSDLPYSQKMFLRGLGARVDESIYQCGRIFRLPGTVHEKTSKKKVLLEEKVGSTLVIPIIPTPQQNLTRLGVADGEGLGEFAILLNRLVTNPPGNGERNRKLYSSACSLYSCGFSSDFVNEFLLKVNDELMEEPLEEVEMKLLLNSSAGAFGEKDG